MKESLAQISMEQEVSVWHAFSAAGTVTLLHCDKSINALKDKRIKHKGLLDISEKLFSAEE